MIGQRGTTRGIDVHAGDPRGAALTRTAICVIVFVALDERGRPKPVPP